MSLQLVSQNLLTGKVIDAGNGSLCPELRVYIESGANTITDENGLFHVNSKFNEYIVRISSIGYKTLESLAVQKKELRF
jgi:hypothetical protein